MIYLDSSAVFKLIREGTESAELRTWLSARAGETMTSSDLCKVEVISTCRLKAPAFLPRAQTFIKRVELIPISPEVTNEATLLGGPLLRSLDAIHLASALSIREDLSAFVAYDHRLADAASAAGLHVVRPGA